MMISLLCAALLAAPEADALAQGLHIFHDEDNTAAKLDAAVKAFDDAIASDPDAARKARAHAFKALALMRQADFKASSDDKLAVLKRGEQEALKGIALDGKCADCHFARGATLGRWGQVRGMMQSLFVVSDVKASFQRAVAIDPGHVSARLALAHMDAKLPRMMGGSRSRAEAAFRDVVKKEPHCTKAMVDLAEHLAEDGETQEAREWAKKARDETEPRNPGEYRKFDRARAVALLQKLGG